MSRYCRRKRTATLASIGVFAVFILAVPSVADETTKDKADESTPVADESDGTSKSDRASVLGAITDDGTYNGLTVGFEYERQVSEKFGIGALVEYTGGSMEALLVAVPVTYRLEQWKFQIAPGYLDSRRQTNFITRFGAGYDFNLGDWTVTPNAKVDVPAADDSKRILVYGVTIGTEF